MKQAKLDGLKAFIARCESPIEAKLGAYLFLQLSDVFEIQVQSSLVVDGREVRLDFAIDDFLDGQEIRIAIECDGHSWHERTKEQAKRDRSRDRLLTTAGWRVMRFTGSEIWRDPARCAHEVAYLALQLAGLQEAS